MTSKFKVYFVNLGCSKNLVDSERMAGMLRREGGEITGAAEEAEVLVINTCSFINEARAEAVETILSGTEWKKERGGRRLFVTGCLPERYKVELTQEIPEADGCFGVGDYAGLVRAVSNTFSQVRRSEPRFAFTPGHYRYLRIADGCDRRCTYCAIPSIRGKYISQPLQKLLEEAEILAKQGAKEMILIAQELNSYGIDLGDGDNLVSLLQELEKIDGITWLRMLYLHPPALEEALIDHIANSDKICAYFDFPIEHINDKILKRMGRMIDRKRIEGKLKLIRKLIPTASIRTSIMTGFPGEGETEFGEMVDFVAEGWFDHLGVFAYSAEEGTAALQFKDAVSEEEALSRMELIMDVQRTISQQKNAGKVGNTFPVLVEGFDEEGNLFGRNESMAPEIDGVIYVEGETAAGDFVEVVIEKAGDYDLWGKVVGRL